MSQNTPKSTSSDVKTRDLVFTASGRTLEKMKNEVTIVSQLSGSTFTLVSDEGKFHGGDGDAPLPIAFFVAGLTTCLMTQIKAFAKHFDVVLKDLKVDATFQWQFSQKGSGPYETRPVGISIDIDVDTDADYEKVRDLIQAAQKGCFIEQTVTMGVPIKHRLKFGDAWAKV